MKKISDGSVPSAEVRSRSCRKTEGTRKGVRLYGIAIKHIVFDNYIVNVAVNLQIN